MISPLFMATKQHLESLIHGGKQETELPPPIRMTLAGDDVE
jgi:hypothetical protein